MSRRGRRRGSRGGDGSDGWDKWEGGYMEAKKSKLQQQFNKSIVDDKDADKQTTNIFTGVSIFVNGYTVPCAEELKRLMSIHGGQYHHYYARARTSHIIATNLPDTKIKELRGEKIIKPEWVTDSIRHGKLLPYQPYQLYAQASRSQPTINFARTDKKSAPQETEPELSSKEDSRNSVNVDEFQVLESWQLDIKKTPVNTIKIIAEVPVKTENCPKPKIKSRNLLSEFYDNSRLHYISTMATKFKSYVSKLHKDLEDVGFPGRTGLLEWTRSQRTSSRDAAPFVPQHEKIVIHVDMDCFFVSVGIRNRPELKGMPVAVAHSKGTAPRKSEGPESESLLYEANYYRNKMPKGLSEDDDGEMTIDDSSDEERVFKPKNVPEFGSMSEIACCSYEARSHGVRNGKLLGEALKLCPELKMIPYDFKSYEEVATILYDLVASFTLNLEAVSCDELFADCTDVLTETGATPLEFATFLRQEVLSKTKCSCSVGIGENMLLARLANKCAKPDGQLQVRHEEVASFMADKKIADLPGVGWALNMRIKTISSGIEKCGDLQKIPLKTLQNELGPKTGIQLHNSCRGIDDRPVGIDKERKSVSAEINYGIRFTKDDEAFAFLTELAGEVRNRLQSVPAKGRTITLKLKVRKKDAPVETAKFMGHGICDNMSRSSTLKIATDDAHIIAKECISLLQQMRIPPADLRGMAIQVSRLQLRNQADNLRDNSTLHRFLKPRQEVADSVRPKASEPSGLWPSNFEDLDESVLASLPKDIRLQVEKEFKAKPVMVEPEPTRNHENLHPLSLSQIDPTVLDQLPKDIVDEITSAYGAQKVQSSPAKDRSPRTKKQTRPRRTPKKSSPDKMKAPYRHLTITQLFGNKEVGTGEDEREVFKVTPQVIPETPTPSQCLGVNLMGRVEMMDVRKLVTEWIEEFDEPLAEDEDIFQRYLLALIAERDLEKVNLVIRHTCRHLLRKKKSGWQKFYTSAVNEVQQTVRRSYEADLDVPLLKFSDCDNI